MITSSRSERGWRGRRRIAVLVSVAGVLGVMALGTAGTASAEPVANCNAKLEPKGKGLSTNAKLSFVCDRDVRTFGLASNKPIKNYGAPSAGAATAFTCEGTGAGFGCGISDRATPGTQTVGTTGWSATAGVFPSATTDPTTCGGFKRIASGPNRNGIVGPPCTQLLAAGTKVTQTVKLAQSPCSSTEKNPLNVYLFVGGEPSVTSFTTGGDSTTVGEYLSAPLPVNMKAYKGCQGDKEKGKGASKSSAPATKFPVGCSGVIEPKVAGQANADVKYVFSCNQNIRAFAIYSNKVIDLPSEEPSVTGPNGGGLNESALHQCEGALPGAGFGCGITDRQTQNASVPNGNGISGGNTAEGSFGFEFAPCKKPGEAKPKAWLVVMGEPVIDGKVGEFISQPFQLPISGYGKCKGGKGKGGPKK